VSQGFFERLAGFVVRYRWLVVSLWAAVLAAAMVALPGLGSEVNSDRSYGTSRTWSCVVGGPERSWAAWLPAVVR